MTAFQAGWNYGETTEDFAVRYEVKPAPITPGTYRNITGNLALAYGLIAASQLARLPLFLGSYPITPASDILHELAKHKKFGVRTFQAEDEIAAVGAALGASFGGSLAVTTTSGPGMLLKAETVGLAVSVELPLIVVDVQRAGPSTGMPTKTEQTDLLHGDVRPERRVAGPGRRGRQPVGLLLRGDRGGADRGHLPDAGHPAVRRLPGQRLRAVAHPGRRRPARPEPEFAFATPADQGENGLRAVPARPGDAGPAVGDPGHPRPRAPHRRHREGRRHREHLLRPGQPRPDGPPAPAKIDGHRGRRPAARGRRPVRRRPGARARLGLHLRLDRRRGPPGPAAPGTTSRRRTCGT